MKISKLHLFFVLLLLLLPAVPSFAQEFRIESVQGQDAAAGEVIVRFRDGVSAQLEAVRDQDLFSSEAVGRTGAVRLRSRNRSTAELLQAYRNRFDVLYVEPNYIYRTHDVPNDSLFN